MTVDEDTSAEEVIEALGHLNTEAQKCNQVVGNLVWESPWDKAHERINKLLDDLDKIKRSYTLPHRTEPSD